MITKPKPYPAMKDSGVEWLGEVPESWVVLRGRRLFDIRKRIAGELGYPVISVTQAGLRIRNVETGEGQVSQDYSKYQIVKVGEFAMNSMDLLTGGVGIAASPGVTSPDYRVFAIREVNRCRDRYMLHVLRLLYQNRGFYAWGQGSAQLGRWRLPRKRFNDFPFPVPPSSDQAAIVRFIGHVDRRIRRYIRAKQKLIRLLEEQKQAIIHRAVTRGLDPDVALKDSGVEWLGKVPEHWDVQRLRNTADMRVSNVDKHAKEGEIPVRLCNYVDVYKNDHISQRIGFMRATATAEEIERFRLEKDDVLITKDSEAWDDIGVPALVTKPALDLISGYHLALLRPRADRLVGGFLFRALQSKGLAYQFHVEARGVTRYGLSHAGIKSVWMPLPPLPEQGAIVEYLDEAMADIDRAIARATREIELLNEYRTSLIADIVTGKLDVREAAASLPDESDSSEPETDLEDLIEAETDHGDDEEHHDQEHDDE